jgi:hypothetical protein
MYNTSSNESDIKAYNKDGKLGTKLRSNEVVKTISFGKKENI